MRSIALPIRPIHAAAWGVLLLAAIYWRVPRITDEWPFRYMESIQLSSAVATRTQWLRGKASPTPEEKAWIQARPGRDLEPPILQTLTVWVYRIAGREIPWVSGCFSALFWLLAVFPLGRIARELGLGEAGRFSAAAYYWLTPFGIVLSLSFQPESLMMLGFLWGLAIALPLAREVSWGRLAAGALACGLLALVKPGPTIPSLVAVFAVRRRGLRATLLFAGLAALPSLLYVARHVWLRALPGETPLDELTQTLGKYVTTSELLQLQTYLDIVEKWPRVTGLAPLALSVGALFLPRRHRAAPVLRALAAGYLVNGLCFTWHFRTSDYYQVLLLPWVALSLGLLADRLAEDVRVRWRPATAALGLALLAVAFYRFGEPSAYRTHHPGFPDRTVYRDIESAVGRSGVVLAVTPHFSQDLRYFSWVLTPRWPDWLDEILARRDLPPESIGTLVRRLADRHGATRLAVVAPEAAPGGAKVLRALEAVPRLYASDGAVVYDLGARGER